MSKNRPKITIPVPATIEDTRLNLLISCLTAAVTFLVFLPVLNNGFVNWDDINTISENLHYRGLGWQQLKWMFTTFHMGPYQPLSWVSYGIDYLLWGMKPFGYHLTNIVLHSVNAAIFCLLNLKLLVLASAPSERGNRTDFYLAAAFSALFFSIHPLRVESVAWVTERRDVLSGLFYLLTVLWYVKTRSGDEARPSFWERHALPLTFCLLALLSKGMAISLPVVLLILDFYPLKRLDLNSGSLFSDGNRAVWLEKVPYFLMAAPFGLVGLFGQAHAGTLRSYENTGFSVRAAQIPYAVGFYIWKTVLPFALSPLYKFIGGLTDPTVLLCSAVMLAFTAAAISVRRNRPLFPAVWLYYLAVLAPVSGIVKFGFQATADRYTYLPCLGFAVLAGAGLFASRRIQAQPIKNMCLAAACLITAALGGLSWRQTHIWLDSESLWRRALVVDPGLEIAHSNLSAVLLARGRLDESVEQGLMALEIKPDYAITRNNLCLALLRQGKFDEAVKHGREAVRLDPDSFEIAFNLADALAADGKLEEAVKYYRQALRFNPETEEIYLKLGLISVSQGKTDEAVRLYQETLQAHPGFAKIHLNLGTILAGRGQIMEAEKHYREALRLDPDYGKAHFSLGIILARLGKRSEAAGQFKEVLRLNPGDAQARANMAVLGGK